MKILVTGSSGLIGSEAVQHFDAAGHTVHGIDNNMRREFFGPPGDTTWNLQRLMRETRPGQRHGRRMQLAKSVMMLPEVTCRLAWTAELNSRGSRNRGCPQPCSIGLGDGYLSTNGNANFAPAARLTLSARELSEETHDWYVGLIDRR